MAVALTDGAIAIVSADTWEQRFKVGAGLAMAEASGAALAFRYGTKSAFGIGALFSLVSAASVHKRQEQLISSFLAQEFEDIDWSSLPREQGHRLREEARKLLFETQPIPEEFIEFPREQWGGTDIDDDMILDGMPEQDIDGPPLYYLQE